MDAILSAGGTPSDALVGPSGYSDEYVNALRAYYAAQAAPSGGEAEADPAEAAVEAEKVRCL